ncbi:MAG TPA: phytanoyl-CoA dioxygenase family protein [Acidimicrobiales bacterium]|nr:phytanoyl-CoA dioxygenase family protein [Acidimicrobiales bacterium]
MDPVEFHRNEAPPLLTGDRGELAGVCARGLGSLVLAVGGSTWTYRELNGRLAIEEGPRDDARVWVSMEPDAWSDLALSMRTCISLQLAGELSLNRGSFGQLSRWEGVLRALHLGIPSYDPERVQLRSSDGTPLDLARVFSFDELTKKEKTSELAEAAEAAEAAEFLHAAGYLHVRGVFDPHEMERLAEETNRIEDEVDNRDPFTWWADRADGERVLCRVIYADRKSALIGELADDPRLLSLAALLGSPVAALNDRMDGPTLVLKPAGQLVGLANLPWHQDCGLGGHPVICPSVAIGIQITGSSPETGYLEVVAGSQGQWILNDLDEKSMTGWPRVDILTEPGDVTVHIQDVVHRSPAPTGAGGRKTLYLSYYPPDLVDHIGPGQAVNDLIRGRQSQADAIRAG